MAVLMPNACVVNLTEGFSAQDIPVLETLSEDIGRLYDAAVWVEGNVVKWAGLTKDIPPLAADEVISLADHVVIPGLINSHTHMWQSLTRCIAQVPQIAPFYPARLGPQDCIDLTI